MNFKLNHLFTVYGLGMLFLGEKLYTTNDPEPASQDNMLEKTIDPQPPIAQGQNQQGIEDIQQFFQEIQNEKKILKSAHSADLEKVDITLKTSEDFRKGIETQLTKLQGPQEGFKTKVQELYQEWEDAYIHLAKVQSGVKNFKKSNLLSPQHPQGLERLCNVEKKAYNKVQEVESLIREVQSHQKELGSQQEKLKDTLKQTNLHINQVQQHRKELKFTFDKQIEKLENQEQKLHISAFHLQNLHPLQDLTKHNLEQQE